MKYKLCTGVLLMFLFQMFLCDKSVGQSDTISSDQKYPSRLKEYYMGIGSGFSLFLFKGYSCGGSFKIIDESNFGGGIYYRLYLHRGENHPEDYFGMRLGLDNLNIVSPMVIYHFPLYNASNRIGFEGGPAWVRYSELQYTENQGYIEGESECNLLWCDPSHHTEREVYYTVGLTLRAKIDISFSRHAGIEIAYFTNLNAYRSIGGVEISLVFGLVNESIKPKRIKSIEIM